MFSKDFSFLVLFVFIEIKEKILDSVSKTAIIDVNSSMISVSTILEICKEVMTNRQKPRSVADVFSI